MGAAVHPSICCSAPSSPPFCICLSVLHNRFPFFYYLSPAFCFCAHLSLSPANESQWGFSVAASSFLSARYQGPNCLLLPYQHKEGKKKRDGEKKVPELSVCSGVGVDLRPHWSKQVAGQKARGVVWKHTALHTVAVRELLVTIFCQTNAHEFISLW